MVNWDLHSCSKLTWWGAVWAMLWLLGRFVFNPGKELIHVHWHGYVHVTLCVVPFEGDSAVECAIPILFECVVFAECCDEVVGMLLAFVFDSKIIDSECELNGS